MQSTKNYLVLVNHILSVELYNNFPFRNTFGEWTSISPTYNGFKTATKPIQDYDEINEYTKCPPLPPRPIQKLDPITNPLKCQDQE